MTKHNAKRTALLQEGFRAVLHADNDLLDKTAATMSKKEDFWNPLLKQVCFESMTAEEIELLTGSDDLDGIAEQLFMAGTPKSMLSRVPLGVIELRDNPIERICYRGTLDRKSKIASLLVLAGYSEASNFNSFDEIGEMLKLRAEQAVNPVVAVEVPEEEILPEENYEESGEEENFSTLDSLMNPVQDIEDTDETIENGEPAVEALEAVEEGPVEEPLSEEVEAPTEAQTASQHGLTEVPDVTDPEVYQELRDNVEAEMVEDRRNLQLAALRSLNPFKRRSRMVEDSPAVPSTARKITVVQEEFIPAELPAEVAVETHVHNDNEDEPILVDEWASIEKLFAADNTKV